MKPQQKKIRARPLAGEGADSIAKQSSEQPGMGWGLGEGTSKGGGDKWLKMASAMDAALDRMRTLHATVNRMQFICQRDRVDVHDSTLRAVLQEIADVANILKTGLKAR